MNQYQITYYFANYKGYLNLSKCEVDRGEVKKVILTNFSTALVHVLNRNTRDLLNTLSIINF